MPNSTHTNVAALYATDRPDELRAAIRAALAAWHVGSTATITIHEHTIDRPSQEWRAAIDIKSPTLLLCGYGPNPNTALARAAGELMRAIQESYRRSYLAICALSASAPEEAPHG